MRKVDTLNEVLKKIKEQDDALSVATAPDISASDVIADMPDGGMAPVAYDNQFFSGLKEGDEFSDKDDPSIRYKVMGNPEMDEEGTVTSLPCEVMEAPDENTKGVAVGDTFDAISEMPGASAPMENKVDNPGTPPIVPDHSPVPKEKTPPEEPAKGKQIPANKNRSNDQIPGLTRPPKVVPEPNKAESVPAVTTQVRKNRKFNPPDDPEKGKNVSGERLNKRKEGFTLRKRFGEAASAKGIVQSVSTKDGVKIAIVRIGNAKYHLEIPPASGADVGDEVEVEDMNKITKVVAKAEKK